MTAYVDQVTIKIKFNFGELVSNFEAKNGQVQNYKPEKDWDKRVEEISNKIKEDEILLVSGESGDDGGEIIPDVTKDTA